MRFCAQPSRVAAAVLVVALACAPRAAHAAEVRIPLTIDYLSLTEALKQKMYTAPGGRAALWNGPNECQYLYAEHPAFARAAARVKLETAASLALGMGFGGHCYNAISYDGIVEAETTPYIDGLTVRFRIEDMNLYDTAHQKTTIASRGFDLIKQQLIARLQTFTYDLSPAVKQLDALADQAAAPDVAERVKRAMATLHAEPQVEALDQGIRVTLVLETPNVPAASGTPAEPTAAELAAFEKALNQWDAFLVFAVKQLGEGVGDKQFRDQLMNILVESRYRLVDALAHPTAASQSDPVRALFLDTWKKLGDAVREAAERGMLGARSLEFLSFISAGDALFALDQAAPVLGMKISAADLRSLAHVMAPQLAADPLKYDFAEDPELRKMFGLTEPLKSPGPLEVPGEAPEPSPSSPARTPAPSSGANRIAGTMFALLGPREADAAEEPLVEELRNTAALLYRAVVDENNVARYRGDMGRLLQLAAEHQFGDAAMDPRWHLTYVLLVESAAWQESCWRQFVRAGKRIRWLESSSGDLGVMQVNKHVWRGLLNIERLEWDVLYNADAGAQILLWMMQDVLRRPKIDPVPVEDHVARSAYAAYNGGPDAYKRWRGHESEKARQIDAMFWTKYQALEEGQTIDILNCAHNWAQSARPLTVLTSRGHRRPESPRR
jgi:Transglycosylase SLT domain